MIPASAFATLTAASAGKTFEPLSFLYDVGMTFPRLKRPGWPRWDKSLVLLPRVPRLPRTQWLTRPSRPRTS
jgi:hypothetical protein